MAGLPVPPQSFYFYDVKWSPEVDHSFIDALKVQAGNGLVRFNDSNSLAIEYAKGALIGEYDIVYSTAECKDRFRHLRSRFVAFNTLLKQKGVSWDVSNNFVTAPKVVWVSMEKSFKISPAYYHEGEPEWENLQAIFKIPAPIAHGTDIVQISEDTEVISITDEDLHPIEDHHDEISSLPSAKLPNYASDSSNSLSDYVPNDITSSTDTVRNIHSRMSFQEYIRKHGKHINGFSDSTSSTDSWSPSKKSKPAK